MEEVCGAPIEELRGGLIEDYILEFVQACSNEPNSDLAKMNVPLSIAAEQERARKYSFDKIRKIFLVYNKCKGTQEDTVIKALSENYFIRAYVSYKIPQVQRTDFLKKPAIANSISHNELIVNSFGETEASLCAMDITAADNRENLETRIAALETELASKNRRIEEYEVDIKLEASARRKMQEEHAAEIRQLNEEQALEFSRIREQAENEAQKIIRRGELASAERNRELSLALESVEKRLAYVNTEIQTIQNESISRLAAAEMSFSKAKNEIEKMAREQYEERVLDNKKIADSLRQTIDIDATKILKLENEISRLKGELSFIAGTSLEDSTKLKSEIILIKDERETCRQEIAKLKTKFAELLPQVYLEMNQGQTLESLKSANACTIF